MDYEIHSSIPEGIDQVLHSMIDVARVTKVGYANYVEKSRTVGELVCGMAANYRSVSRQVTHAMWQN